MLGLSSQQNSQSSSISPQSSTTEKKDTSSTSGLSDKEFITLVSAEKFEFVLSKKAAGQSRYLFQLITDDIFQTNDRITLDDISSDVLEILCQYLYVLIIRRFLFS